MYLYYHPSYVSPDMPTTVKCQWLAEANADFIHPAGQALMSQLASVHDLQYILAVSKGTPLPLAESNGFTWNRLNYQSATLSTGGVLNAVEEAFRTEVSGSLSIGLHHARRESGAGFCTFNGLAIAAIRARIQTLGRILILDLDAHCGGGTSSILQDHYPNIVHADISVSDFDAYTPTGYNTLEIVRKPGLYLQTIERRLNALGNDFGLIIYNAGMDPHEHDDVGGMDGITSRMLATREQMVFDYARDHQIPIAFVLAGGYIGTRQTRETLTALHQLTVNAALDISF